MKRAFSRFDVPDYDDPNVLLLTRWRLFDSKPFGVYLHHLRRSDSPNRPLHDHPWDFISLRLWRNYVEIRPWATGLVPFGDTFGIDGPHWVTFRRAEDRHRVIVDNPRGCWTFVVRFRRRRKWGFQDPGEVWVRHDLAPGPEAIDTADR